MFIRDNAPFIGFCLFVVLALATCSRHSQRMRWSQWAVSVSCLVLLGALNVCQWSHPQPVPMISAGSSFIQTPDHYLPTSSPSTDMTGHHLNAQEIAILSSEHPSAGTYEMVGPSSSDQWYLDRLPTTDAALSRLLRKWGSQGEVEQVSYDFAGHPAHQVTWKLRKGAALTEDQKIALLKSRPAPSIPFWRTEMGMNSVQFALMLLGMFGKTLWDAIDGRKKHGKPRIDTWNFVKPAIVAPIVFLTIKLVSSPNLNVTMMCFAFQNGFFWQTILAGTAAQVTAQEDTLAARPVVVNA